MKLYKLVVIRLEEEVKRYEALYRSSGKTSGFVFGW